MRATDGFGLTNSSASSALVALQGGYYQLAASATWSGGSVKGQQLGPDGSTLLDPPSFSLSANGVVYAYLPAGMYKITVTTATAVYAALSRVPLE